MIGLECAYCGSENIWLEKVNICPDNPALVDAHILCADCGREDLAGCRTDYLIWFLYRLLPDMPLLEEKRKLRVMKGPRPTDKGPDGAA